MALWGEQLLENDFNSSRVYSGGGSGSVTLAEASEVIRYNHSDVQTHIKKLIKGDKKKITFSGIKELKQAADKNILRQGQIIFGTVSLAHHMGMERKGMKTPQGWFTNLISSYLIEKKTGQKRDFVYLHAGVYAGKRRKTKEQKGLEYYVIENGGYNDPVTRKGFIAARKIEEAFEEKSNFFVMSPPKDGNKRSTRYLVLQKALACLGLCYTYDMQAVSCETFVTALLLSMNDNNFLHIQNGIINGPKGHKADENEAFRRFKRFKDDLRNRIKMVPNGVLLTLEYFLQVPPKDSDENENGKCPDWILQMQKEYEQFFDAAARGDSAQCKQILSNGLNPSVSRGGKTAVEKALEGGHKDTIVVLLEEGADATTALITSVERGCINDIQLLVEVGVDVDLKNSSGCTALMKATQKNHLDIVMKLIDANANKDLQDKYGETVLIKATQKNCLEIVKVLIDSRAGIENCNHSQYTALLMAAEYGHTEIVKELIKAGADINHEDLDGNTAIIVAAKNNSDANTIKELIKEAHKRTELSIINHQNKGGRTAMMMASRRGEVSIVQELLQAGANREKQDKNGKTALQMAQDFDYMDTVNIIEQFPN